LKSTCCGWQILLNFFAFSSILRFELRASWLLGQVLRAFEPLHQTLFYDFFFFSVVGFLELFVQGWLQTLILLICSFEVARITGLSHGCLVQITKSSLNSGIMSLRKALSFFHGTDSHRRQGSMFFFFPENFRVICLFQTFFLAVVEFELSTSSLLGSCLL
jgi:hypothetical protein